MGAVNSELPNPPVSTPLLSNESTSNEAAVGLHPVNPLIALFELSAPYVVLPDTDTYEIPREGNLTVQVGTKVELNFVNAVSTTFPDFTNPVSVSVGSAANQDRLALGAELRTTDAMAPDLATFIKNPSRFPTRFFPANFSALDPKTFTDPSAPRTNVFA